VKTALLALEKNKEGIAIMAIPSFDLMIKLLQNP
jgi:hypothetical protein